MLGVPAPKCSVARLAGPPMETDDVHLDSEDGLLVAEIPEGPPKPDRMHLLAPNLIIEVDTTGRPVIVEARRNMGFWLVRARLKPDISIRSGQIAVIGPADYDYWTDAPAEVARSSAERGAALILLEFGDPELGVRISPRVVFFLTKNDQISSILLTNVQSLR